MLAAIQNYDADEESEGGVVRLSQAQVRSLRFTPENVHGGRISHRRPSTNLDIEDYEDVTSISPCSMVTEGTPLPLNVNNPFYQTFESLQPPRIGTIANEIDALSLNDVPPPFKRPNFTPRERRGADTPLSLQNGYQSNNEFNRANQRFPQPSQSQAYRNANSTQFGPPREDCRENNRNYNNNNNNNYANSNAGGGRDDFFEENRNPNGAFHSFPRRYQQTYRRGGGGRRGGYQPPTVVNINLPPQSLNPWANIHPFYNGMAQHPYQYPSEVGAITYPGTNNPAVLISTNFGSNNPGAVTQHRSTYPDYAYSKTAMDRQESKIQPADDDDVQFIQVVNNGNGISSNSRKRKSSSGSSSSHTSSQGSLQTINTISTIQSTRSGGVPIIPGRNWIKPRRSYNLTEVPLDRGSSRNPTRRSELFSARPNRNNENEAIFSMRNIQSVRDTRIPQLQALQISPEKLQAFHEAPASKEVIQQSLENLSDRPRPVVEEKFVDIDFGGNGGENVEAEEDKANVSKGKRSPNDPLYDPLIDADDDEIIYDEANLLAADEAILSDDEDTSLNYCSTPTPDIEINSEENRSSSPAEQYVFNRFPNLSIDEGVRMEA